MIKNIIAIKLADTVTPSMVEDLNHAIQKRPFLPCESNEAFTFGYLPHPDSDQYVRTIGHYHLVSFVFEKKTVPTKLVKQMVEEMIREYQDRSGGRKPTKEEIVEMKDMAHDSLLPRAFPKRTEVLMWIDNKHGLLFIEASSLKTAEITLASLRNAYPDFPPGAFINTALSPTTLMTKWILDQEIQGFTVDDRCDMVLPVERKPTIKYVNHTLSGEEINGFISEGRSVVSLGLTFKDKISFLLNDKFIIKGIKFGEYLARQFAEDETDLAGQFLVVANDLSCLVNALVDHMGGYLAHAAQDKPKLEDESAEQLAA